MAGGTFKILPDLRIVRPFKNKPRRIKMLRPDTKLATPFLCCCFWSIVFSVFVSFYIQLVSYTHLIHDDGKVCTTIPHQTQYHWVKHDYFWKGGGNITDITLRQECPDSKIDTKVYAGNSHLGGTSENNANTFIFNRCSEILYTITDSTLYDRGGTPIGLFNFDADSLTLKTANGTLIAQWGFGSYAITLSVPPSTTEADLVLLFSIAGKHGFGNYNECSTKYWSSLQMVIIAGILGLASIVGGCIMIFKHKEKEIRYSRKTINLKLVNKN